jgi:predicted transcriptional regulator
MPLTTTSIKIDADIKERLHRLAAAKRRSANWLMGEAITQFVAREEAREKFHQDAIDAWNDFKATGKYVSAERADAWLDRLEAGEDVDPPEETTEG